MVVRMGTQYIITETTSRRNTRGRPGMFAGSWEGFLYRREARRRGEGRYTMMLALLHGLIIAAFLAISARIPRRRQPFVSRDSFINVANGGLLAALRFAFANTLATTAAVASPLPRCDLSWITGLLAQFAAAFLLTDLTRYGLHYLHHRVDFLWRFHAVHHSSTRLDATSGLRMHVVDFIQLSLIPVVLFGMLFDASRFDPWVWPAVVVVTDLFDAFQHADIDMSLDRPLAAAWGRIFNNPVFHSWHHSTNPGEYNGNYGQALTVWDRLFGTHIPHRQAASSLGLPPSERLRNSLLGLQMLQPEGPGDVESEFYPERAVSS